MALFARLELRQGQSLVMTPQLLQAIKLLQLSNLELAAFVEAELERNPLLERADDRRRRRGEGRGADDAETATATTPASDASERRLARHELDAERAEIERDLDTESRQRLPGRDAGHDARRSATQATLGR